MRPTAKLTTFVITLLIIPNLLLAGNTEVIFSMDAGYTDNVFGDSASYSDSYTAPSMQLNYYPTSTLRLNFNGRYTAYQSISGLNQISGGGNITFVTAKPNQPVSVYLTAGFNAVDYGQEYDPYDQTQPYLSTIIRARLISRLVFSTGGNIRNIRYSNSEYSDYFQYNLFAGMNLSLPAANNLYVEAGLTGADFNLQTNLKNNFIPGPHSSYDPISRLDLHYYRIRYSRPLAAHTGINLQFRSQSPAYREGDAFFGYSIDNLSPWNQFRYGESVSGGIKSYIIPDFILIGDASWSKYDFYGVIETDNDDSPFIINRNDETVTASIEIQRPFGGNNKALITPTLFVSYTDNRSNDPNYSFDSFSVLFGFNVQL